MTPTPKPPAQVTVAAAVLGVCAAILTMAPPALAGTDSPDAADPPGDPGIGSMPACDSIHISARTDAQLVSLLTAKAIDSLVASRVHPDCVFTVMDSLTARRAVEVLVTAIDHPADATQKKYAILAAYHLDDARVVAAMARHLTSETTAAAYYATNYMAKRGDRQALAVLYSNGGHYGISSVQWAATVRLFGKYKFMPAVPYLIDSLDAASMNVGAAAMESLLDIFPGPNPPEIGSVAWQEYFTGRYREYLASEGQNEVK